MDEHRCHDCGLAIAARDVAWLSPADHRPDEADGEPFCPACAGPVVIAA